MITWPLSFCLHFLAREELSFRFNDLYDLSEKRHDIFVASFGSQCCENPLAKLFQKINKFFLIFVRKCLNFRFEVFYFLLLYHQWAAVCPLITSGAKRKSPPLSWFYRSGWEKNPKNPKSHQKNPQSLIAPNPPGLVEGNRLPLRGSIAASFISSFGFIQFSFLNHNFIFETNTKLHLKVFLNFTT